MSTGPRIPLDRAMKLLVFLAEKTGIAINPDAGAEAALAPDAPRLFLVGSARRGCPEVGDLEFIAPLRAYAMGPDPVAEWVSTYFEHEKDRAKRAESVPPLPKPEKCIGTLHKGGRADDWKQANLSVSMRVDPANPGRGSFAFPIQVFRYEPGPDGNRGWIEVIRTGCADFGQAMLTKWKARNGLGPDDAGSEDGYLIDPFGKRIQQATEAEVFEACGVSLLSPAQRTDSAAQDVFRMARGVMR